MSKIGDLRRAIRLLDEAQQTYPDGRSSDRLRIVRAIVLTHMKDATGADAVLVGEALVTSGDPADAVSSFRSVARRGRPLPEGAQA